MADFERDLLLRQIRQLGDMVAALLGRARSGGRWESGLESIREITATGFGPDRSLLDRVDAVTVVMLLHDPEAALVYAGVLEAESELLAALGRAGEAAARRERAARIVAAARSLA